MCVRARRNRIEKIDPGEERERLLVNTGFGLGFLHSPTLEVEKSWGDTSSKRIE